MVIVYHQEGSRKILVMLQWNRPATPPRLCIILMPPPPLLTVNFFMYSLNALLATTNPPHVASKHYVTPRREIDNDCSLSQPR